LLDLRDAPNPDRIGRMRRIVFAAILLMSCGGMVAGLATAASQNAGQQQFDILIRNGRVLDGSGNPWRRADIGIRGDRIVAVGTLAGATAATVVDAKDRVVAPGFFDVHSHALEGLTRAELRDGRPLLAQGVTTIVGNPDGGGGTDLKRQFATIEADGGVGVNVALLIGHASIRSAVLGDQQRREPTAAELERMIALVKQGVADGAFGLSSGLFYQPGRFSKTEEVIALARAAGGVYSSHIRDEGDYDYGLIPSVDEVIRIAEEGHVRGVVSHVKALGPDNWGKSRTIVEHIDAARAAWRCTRTSIPTRLRPRVCRRR
jgi:N-acyl-D-amino-acid deacylase